MLTGYEVLIRLPSSGEPLRMKDLADRLLLTQSGATRLIQRIEPAGLVERNPSPEDRRGRIVTLTPEGTRTVDLAIPVFLTAVRDNVTATLSKRDLAAAHRALGALLKAHDVIPEG